MNDFIKTIGSILEFIFEIIVEVFKGLFEYIESLLESERKTELDADFVHVYEILKRQDKGFCLTGE